MRDVKDNHHPQAPQLANQPNSIKQHLSPSALRPVIPFLYLVLSKNGVYTAKVQFYRESSWYSI
jgi:hypothetical protein